MVFADVRTALAFTFVGYARSGDFTQAINIVSLEPQFRFDFLTHVLGPRFGTESTDTQVKVCFRHAVFIHGLSQVKRIRRCTGQACHLQVTKQVQVLFRISGRSRNYRRSQVFHPVMKSQTTGKQTVSVTYRKDIVTGNAVSRQTTGGSFFPDVQVPAGITDDRRITGSARRSMHTDNLLQRSGLKAVRIIVAQILLGRERQFDDIVYCLYIIRSNVQLLKLVPVERGVVVHQVYQLMQSLALKFSHLFAAHAFFTLVPNHKCVFCLCIKIQVIQSSGWSIRKAFIRSFMTG